MKRRNGRHRHSRNLKSVNLSINDHRVTTNEFKDYCLLQLVEKYTNKW